MPAHAYLPLSSQEEVGSEGAASASLLRTPGGTGCKARPDQAAGESEDEGPGGPLEARWLLRRQHLKRGATGAAALACIAGLALAATAPWRVASLRRSANPRIRGVVVEAEGFDLHYAPEPPPAAASEQTTTVRMLASVNFGVTSPMPAASVSVGVLDGPCLCLFDVDRTLTADQDRTRCPNAWPQVGVNDSAFHGGTLQLSDAAMFYETTACRSCFSGIISAGVVSDAAMQSLLARRIRAPGPFSSPQAIISPLIRGCATQGKQSCARGILDWYSMHRNVTIQPSNVYFFDDTAANIQGFAAGGMNARQVSCASRWGLQGACGAQTEEIKLERGLFLCEGAA